MKRSEPLRVGQIIEQALSQAGSRDTYMQQQACSLWSHVVGPTINKYTTRRMVDRDALHVWLTSAPLKNELMFISQQIIDTINRNLGSVVITKLIIH